jgi:TonB family protein
VSIERRSWATWVLVCVLGLVPVAVQSQSEANAEILRKVRSKVAPTYPDLARKMGLSGIVRIEVVVSADGAVKEARVAGGHPVLANAALDAVKKWKFEPAGGESSGTVSVRFDVRQ